MRARRFGPPYPRGLRRIGGILPQFGQAVHFGLQDCRNLFGSGRSGIDLVDQRLKPDGDGASFLIDLRPKSSAFSNGTLGMDYLEDHTCFRLDISHSPRNRFL